MIAPKLWMVRHDLREAFQRACFSVGNWFFINRHFVRPRKMAIGPVCGFVPLNVSITLLF